MTITMLGTHSLKFMWFKLMRINQMGFGFYYTHFYCFKAMRGTEDWRPENFMQTFMQILKLCSSASSCFSFPSPINLYRVKRHSHNRCFDLYFSSSILSHSLQSTVSVIFLLFCVQIIYYFFLLILSLLPFGSALTFDSLVLFFIQILMMIIIQVWFADILSKMVINQLALLMPIQFH